MNKMDCKLNLKSRMLVLAIAVVGCFAPGVEPLAAAPITAEAQAEVERIVGQIEVSYYAAQKALEQLPKDRFERLSVVEEADFKVDAITAWVANNTQWVPYLGVLRGANGVLMDRRGNSLDRALLLLELLQDAGYEARLVRGVLSPESVEQLFSEINTNRFAPATMNTTVTEQARTTALRAVEQAAALSQMIDLPDTLWNVELETAATDHWWVEAKLDSGWKHLDPLLRGPTEALRPEVIERFAGDELPQQLLHKVTVRIVVERWDQGKLLEEVPLEHPLQTADHPYHDLELQFIPFGFGESPENGSASLEAINIADTTQDWLPLLRVGKKNVRQKGFGVDGQLEANLDKPAIGRKLEVATGALGGLGQKKAPATLLSACWIEYRIDQPGRDPRVVRRELFDLIGPARRRSGDVADLALEPGLIRERGLVLSGVHRMLVNSVQLPPVALEKAYLELWGRQGPQLAAFVRLMADPLDKEPLQRFHREPLVGVDLVTYAVARGELSRHREAIYLASPNIFSTHYLLRPGEKPGDELGVTRAMDVVFNEVAVIASGTTPSAQIRLEQGVLDTLLEVDPSLHRERVQNTAVLFSRRDADNGTWSATTLWPEDSGLPGMARARMADAVAAGLLVVAPEHVGAGADAAWWEIDPGNGTTVGIGMKGWGQAVEDVEVRSIGGAGGPPGTEKIGINVSCALVKAMLLTNGWMFVSPGGATMVMAEGFQILLSNPHCRPYFMF